MSDALNSLAWQLSASVQRIIQSHQRGEHCLIRKELKGVKSSQFKGGMSKRYPMLFAEAEVDDETMIALQKVYKIWFMFDLWSDELVKVNLVLKKKRK